MRDLTAPVAETPFFELSRPCADRVDAVLLALSKLGTADAAIAGRQLVRATLKGDGATRRVIRGCARLLAAA